MRLRQDGRGGGGAAVGVADQHHPLPGHFVKSRGKLADGDVAGGGDVAERAREFVRATDVDHRETVGGGEVLDRDPLGLGAVWRAADETGEFVGHKTRIARQDGTRERLGTACRVRREKRRDRQSGSPAGSFRGWDVGAEGTFPMSVNTGNLVLDSGRDPR